jgi:glycosyltransferase involved in cell wall biosynthesis
MKVLWFTNILMPDALTSLGLGSNRGSGFWMSALLDKLKCRESIELAVVTESGATDAEFIVNGVQYFVVRSHPVVSWLSRFRMVPPRWFDDGKLASFASIIKRWQPDVIHIHGTERSYGMVKVLGLTNVPVVVSIQGLMNPCYRKVYGELGPTELNSLLTRGFLSSETEYRRRLYRTQAAVEEQIIKAADIVIGRTEWDQAWTWAFQDKLRYRHVEEIMRPEFNRAEAWQIARCNRYEIMCTTGSVALKGIHVVIEAINLLRPRYPTIKLRIAGGGFDKAATKEYVRYVMRLVDRLKLRDAITFLGWQDAENLVRYLQLSHCYVNASFIENGCNSLQEAMLVGVPVVVSATGGMTSVVESDSTGLLFPAGDPAILARRIEKIFKDDVLAERLGTAGRLTALVRHNPDSIESALVDAYKAALLAPGSDDRKKS